MQVIDPLVETGEYIEQHERWYVRNNFGDALTIANGGDAHGRFIQKWARQERREDARARRDAREQFQARMEAI